MTEQERLHIRAELARRMGYYPKESANGFYWLMLGNDLVSRRGWRDKDGCWDDAPDPFTDAADNRALVAWLAVQPEKTVDRFNAELLKVADPSPLCILLIPARVIAEAAAKALGIQEANE